jgi:hypothetical protein
VRRSITAGLITAGILALTGCGTAAAQPHTQPEPATRVAGSSCASKMRLADPNLTEAQVSALCNASVPAGSPAPAPPVTSQPAPVSTSVTLTNTCTMGYEEDDGTGTYGGFSTQGGGVNIDGNQYAPAMAFQMTLTNPGSATADVGGIAVAFYDASGVEQGSVNAGATGYITGGQSLTWTVRSPLATDGSGTGDQGDQADAQIPLTASSCSLVQWETP